MTCAYSMHEAHTVHARAFPT